MFEIVALMLAGVAAQAAPSPRCTAARPADCLAGSWTGEFTGADWTFEFTRDGTAWTGRYITTKGKNWHPLLGLKVEGDAVTFAIESTPTVTYRLKLNRAAGTLSGTVDIGGFHTLPFSASRKN